MPLLINFITFPIMSKKKRYSKKVSKWMKRKTMSKKFLKENKRNVSCFKIHNASSECLNILELKENDCLLKRSENVEDSFLVKSKSKKEILMPEGYINSALNLLEIIKKSSGNFAKDSYIFPALFCFRQYLELTMKISIAQFKNLGGKYENDDKHSLISLWSSLYCFLEKNKNTKIVEKMIREFDEIDSTSTFFRYPYRKMVEDTSPDRLINIENLQTKMLQLYRFFEGISFIAYNANTTCEDC